MCKSLRRKMEAFLYERQKSAGVCDSVNYDRKGKDHMIDTSYRKNLITVNQIWYPNALSISELLQQKRTADILFVHGVPVEETKGRFRGWQEYHTCMSDLTLPEEKLFAQINKNVRYECRRSERDGIEIRFYKRAEIKTDRKILDIFAEMYEKMYQSKGIETKFNLTAIEKYLETDSICFSAVMAAR